MPCAGWYTCVDSRRLSTVELKSKAFLAVDSGTCVRDGPLQRSCPNQGPCASVLVSAAFGSMSLISQHRCNASVWQCVCMTLRLAFAAAKVAAALPGRTKRAQQSDLFSGLAPGGGLPNRRSNSMDCAESIQL